MDGPHNGPPTHTQNNVNFQYPGESMKHLKNIINVFMHCYLENGHVLFYKITSRTLS